MLSIQHDRGCPHCRHGRRERGNTEGNTSRRDGQRISRDATPPAWAVLVAGQPKFAERGVQPTVRSAQKLNLFVAQRLFTSHAAELAPKRLLKPRVLLALVQQAEGERNRTGDNATRAANSAASGWPRWTRAREPSVCCPL